MTELTPPPEDFHGPTCNGMMMSFGGPIDCDGSCRSATPPRDTTDTEALRGEVEALCVLFHNTYEDAALDHGWETQEGSRRPWDDVPEANKETMRTTIASLLAAGYSLPDPTRDAALRAEAWDEGVELCSRREGVQLASRNENPYRIAGGAL